LEAWPNRIIGAALLAWALWLATERGHSILGVFSPRADGVVVPVLQRWRKALLIKKDESDGKRGYIPLVVRTEMSVAESTSLLEARLRSYRGRTYNELLPLLNHPTFLEGIGPSGAAFRMEVSVFWEKKPQGNLRVFGIIDALFGEQTESPIVQSFVIGPEE